MTTPYHSKYFAYELSRAGGAGVERLGRALFDACVDLNPHQIQAALFALRSPLSKGVLLADEVGLGKTIEAGLVAAQFWAERRRHLLVIAPASLRKQWAQELEDKFNLPALVIDGKVLAELKNQGRQNPFFDRNRVLIASMHFVANHADAIAQVPWDLVVIDEAHKLRNSYRKSNRMGQKIRQATKDRRKLLLTATPLQNSLLELYGLSTLIDERLFGDRKAFSSQYANNDGDLEELRQRLQPFCWRTLRKDVVEFIQYTERKATTFPFTPTEQEERLYDALSDYLNRPGTYAFPAGQRHLLVMVVRKLLASSPYAVAGTLEAIQARLIRLKEQVEKEEVQDSEDLLAEIIDEELWTQLLTDQEDGTAKSVSATKPDDQDPADEIDLEELSAEIDELGDYIRWAYSIGVDSKTRALYQALEIGFEQLAKMNAAEKIVIFTESRRTQTFLKSFLEENGYGGQVVTFNGRNNDEASIEIYREWLRENRHSGQITGSAPIDIRQALIDRFRRDAKILIATESGAEGLNLQFCSALINYDLPWNPQRIEQRIGRVHRYGQQHDVVVINFFNEKNAAEQRVLELLEDKFNLFTGVFGASDEVLGALESGTDFESRIHEIYRSCRTSEEIEAAFKKLQHELDEQIKTRQQNTRALLLEHFDQEVHERIKVNLDGTREKLDRIGRMFWSLTKNILEEQATFDDEKLQFELHRPIPEVAEEGIYHLISKEQENREGAFLYRLSHPLGEKVIADAREIDVGCAEVVFDITNHPTRISVVEELCGKSGWLRMDLLQVKSYDTEEYLLFSAIDDDGKNLDQEICEKLFQCQSVGTPTPQDMPGPVRERLKGDAERYIQATISRNLAENNRYFQEAREQLDKWARDQELAAEKKLDDIKRQILEARRLSQQATNMAEQHEFQTGLRELEKKKRRLRREIFDVEDEIDARRDELINELEQRMRQEISTKELFTIRWKVV